MPAFTQRRRVATAAAALAAASGLCHALARASAADDWSMHLTVDNEFSVYFGTATQTDFFAGSGSDWTVTYHFSALGRPPSDYVYVATASDHSVAQGFIGVFTNLTTGLTAVTGAGPWEVFPAGAYEATNPFAPAPWSPWLMPTRAQVDTAIAYATANNLWVAATSVPGYTNGVGPWGTRPDIPGAAAWIWYDSGRGGGAPSPLIGGFNHDEFLVFRIQGVVMTCYPNCDRSSAAPTLNVADFSCFLQRYAAGDPYANCDGSTAEPTLNVADFSCFLGRYAQGCP